LVELDGPVIAAAVTPVRPVAITIAVATPVATVTITIAVATPVATVTISVALIGWSASAVIAPALADIRPACPITGVASVAAVFDTACQKCR
jgi:hypothetical protein